MIAKLIDNSIALFSPSWAANRLQNRLRFQSLQNHEGIREFYNSRSGSGGGYSAGEENRLTQTFGSRRLNENSIPREKVNNLRARSWELYRDNPHARKICRQLESKVIGRGLSPRSLAVNGEGKRFKDFRKRCSEVWAEFITESDFRGRPGQGGQHFVQTQKTALRATVLSGSTFVHMRQLSGQQARKKKLTLPLQVQLIHRDRLDESQDDNDLLWHGIQLGADDERVAYHLFDAHPSEQREGSQKSTPYDARDIIHLFFEEDVDQLDGTPWFSSALLKMRNVEDYEYHELMAAAMSACIVLGFRTSTGANDLSLPYSDNDAYDPTDVDGNPVTNLQPGMVVNLGRDGDLQSFNPQRPNTQVGEFVRHMIRSEACGAPGIKGSSITQDYRQSSFASEKSADNDAWPELEGVQDWFSQSFLQPIYEEVIRTAVSNGLFAGIITNEEFDTNRKKLLRTRWQGPVARSIDPVKDVKAAQERIKSGISTPQREAAIIGEDSYQNLEELREYLEEANEQGVPLDIILQQLGIQQQDGDDTDDEEPLEGEDSQGKKTDGED